MPPPLDLEAEIDRLYQTDLGSFIAERNQLASRLKAAGDAASAKAVKELVKPSVTAWAANQLYWRSRRQFDELLKASERARSLQAARLNDRDAPGLASALEAGERALERAVDAASAKLEEAGHGSAALRQRLATTLRAIAAHGRGPSAPRAGRLTSDLDPPGFAALAALAAAPPARVLVAVPARPRAAADATAAGGREARRTAKIAELEVEIRAAERARAGCHKRLAKAEASESQTAAAARKAAGKVEQAEKALADARAALTRVETAWNRAHTEVAMARAAVARAEETRHRLLTRLDELEAGT